MSVCSELFLLDQGAVGAELAAGLTKIVKKSTDARNVVEQERNETPMMCGRLRAEGI